MKRENIFEKEVNHMKKPILKKAIALTLLGAFTLNIAGCGSTGIVGEFAHSSEYIYQDSYDPSYDDVDNTDNTPKPQEDREYAETDNEEFEQFLDDYFKYAITADTMSYNYSVIDGSKFGIEPPSPATMGDASYEDDVVEKEKAEDQEWYDKLLKFKDADLTKEEYFIYRMLYKSMEMSLKGYDYLWFNEPFAPSDGVHSDIITSYTEYRFDDKQDVEDYLTMLDQMDTYFQCCLDFEERKSKEGYFMSDANADDVIEQCEEFISKKEDNCMIIVFDKKIDSLDFLTDEEKKEFKERDKDIFLNVIVPTYEKTIETFKKLKGTGKDNNGLANYEGGKDYYRDIVYPARCSSSKSVEQEIRALESDMNKQIQEMSSVYYSNPDAYDYYFEEELKDSTDGKTPEEIIDYLTENCMDEFPEVDDIPYDVQYLDESMEVVMDGVLAYHMGVPIDGNMHIIKVNGKDQTGLFNTLAHEGAPGHMYQDEYYNRSNPRPIEAVLGNLGYTEGWAVYSAYEVEKYNEYGTEFDEDLSRMEMINEKLNYDLIGRVDIGVNYEGWTTDDIADFKEEMGFNSGNEEYLYNVVAGDPGTYLSYSVAYLEMQELRDRAESELGSKFDVVSYHKAILDVGPCPFDMLSEVVDEYIEENR